MPIRACPIWRNIYITRGDSGARRVLRRPRCSGDAGGRYIESNNAFADPAHAAAQRRGISRLAPARNDPWTMAPKTALGTIIGTASTSAVGGIGAVAVR